MSVQLDFDKRVQAVTTNVDVVGRVQQLRANASYECHAREY